MSCKATRRPPRCHRCHCLEHSSLVQCLKTKRGGEGRLPVLVLRLARGGYSLTLAGNWSFGYIRVSFTLFWGKNDEKINGRDKSTAKLSRNWSLPIFAGGNTELLGRYWVHLLLHSDKAPFFGILLIILWLQSLPFSFLSRGNRMLPVVTVSALDGLVSIEAVFAGSKNI